MLKELILKNRSYRRFDQSEIVPMRLLRDMVEAARLSASARNMQPLKYMLFNDSDSCTKIFPTLAWAGYLKETSSPNAMNTIVKTLNLFPMAPHYSSVS